MTNAELTELLGGWKGFEIQAIERHDASETQSGRNEVVITLAACSGFAPTCSACGQKRLTVHDTESRRVRELPVFDADCWLLIPRRRVACPDCGAKVEELSWLGRYARVTARLAESVAKLCRLLPGKQVAEYYHLARSTVKAID